MTEPLRLLAFTDAEGFGGAELCLATLLGALPEPFVVAVAGPDETIVERVAAARPGAAWATVAAGDVPSHVRAVRAWRPDVVHVNRSHLLAGGTATVASLLVPGPAVMAVEHLPHRFDEPRRVLLRRRALNGRLQAHASVGHRASRLVEEALGQRSGSVEALPNGVPPLELDPVPRPVPGPIVGTLGRLTEQKGLDLLVRALTHLPEVTLVLVGDGPERPSLEALAAQLGVAERLIVTGWTDDARRWLPALDVFALPSRWEGLPLVILEAMHAGLPVVACDVGSVAEAVRDGTTGYVVAAGDEEAFAERLARLVADPQARSRLGAQGRALAGAEYSAVAMARRYEALYRRISSRRSPMSTARKSSRAAG